MKSGDTQKLEKLIYDILFDPLLDLHKNEGELDRELRRKVYKAIGLGMGAGALAFAGAVFLFVGLRDPVVSVSRGDVVFFTVVAAILGVVVSYLAARMMMSLQSSRILDPELYRNGAGIGSPAMMTISQKIAAEMRRKVDDLSASESDAAAAKQDAAVEEDGDDPESVSTFIPNDQAEQRFVLSLVDSRATHGAFRSLAFVTERDDSLTYEQVPHLIELRGYDGYGPTYLIFERLDCNRCGQKVRTSTTYRVRLNPADLGGLIQEEGQIPPPGIYFHEDYEPKHSGPLWKYEWYCESCASDVEISGRASRANPRRVLAL